MTAFNFDEQAMKNQARRDAHPTWPSHQGAIYYPDGSIERGQEVLPIMRWRRVGYCKYCHDTHRNWWLMDANDYKIDDDSRDIFVLCGRCTHTSTWDCCNIWPIGQR